MLPHDRIDQFLPETYGNIGDWNVAAITGMFQDAAAFNQSLAAWNVARVTRMDSIPLEWEAKARFH